MKIDVRDLDYLNEDEEDKLNTKVRGSKKQPVKVRIPNEFKKKDNRKFNKHPHKNKPGFEDDEE